MWNQITEHLIRIKETGFDTERRIIVDGPTIHLYCSCSRCKKFRPVTESFVQVLPAALERGWLARNKIPKTCDIQKNKNAKENPKSNSYYPQIRRYRVLLENARLTGNDEKVEMYKKLIKDLDRVRHRHRQTRVIYPDGFVEAPLAPVPVPAPVPAPVPVPVVAPVPVPVVVPVPALDHPSYEGYG